VSIQRDSEAICSEIYCLLREERERLGLSKYALAGKTGLSQQTIGYLERGKTSPSLDTVLRLVRAMELNFGKLLAEAEGRAEGNAVVRRKPAAKSDASKKSSRR
jgi:transcriptional regulator with XRE-family HTH domain